MKKKLENSNKYVRRTVPMTCDAIAADEGFGGEGVNSKINQTDLWIDDN